MDHIQGLGFFQPLYEDNLEVHIWGPPSTTLDLGERLTRYLSPPLFPVHLRELPCRLTVHDVPAGSFEIGRFKIRAEPVCHPGPTLGYQIVEDGVAIAYIPDHEPALGVPDFPGPLDWTSGFELAAKVDLLIHDAQYTEVEYYDHVGWGHSAIPHALAFARAAGVKRLVLFHHDPGHSDSALDRIIGEACKSSDLPFEILPGAEDTTLELAGQVSP
jgi:ribonuclease BN (tRNA processing enzyme)